MSELVTTQQSHEAAAQPSGPHFHLPARPSGDAGQPVPVPLAVSVHNLRKSFAHGAGEVNVLRGVDLQVRTGEFLAIVGQSGSGKSTLLHLMATLDQPGSGEICFQGRRIDNLPAADREQLRNSRLGMVFQFYHLLPELSALENVMLAGMIRGGVWGYWRRRRQLRRRAVQWLEMVGLSHRLSHRPSELSGGEMQRVAIARALVTEPEILLADEPTGNLDGNTGSEIVSILRRLNEQHQLTIVMVTHDNALAQQASRTVRLVNGRVESS